MKYSLAFLSILFLPDVLALALPSIPKLVSKHFGSAIQKRDAASKAEGELDYFKQVARQRAQDLRRRGLPGPKQLLPRRGSPLAVSTLSPSTTSTGPDGYLPSDPMQNAHNVIVGGHPFAGHGPAIVTGRPPAPTTVGRNDWNVTLTLSYTGTAPPIQNATATIYAPAVTGSCGPMPVPEYVDDTGNFLPPDQQPGYNGSISYNGTYTPKDCSAPAPVPVEEVLIEGHVGENHTEVVEIDMIPLPEDSPTQTFYDAGRNASGSLLGQPSTSGSYSSYAPTSTYGGGLSTTGSAPASASSSTRQRVPDAGNPAFVGPKVRDPVEAFGNAVRGRV